MYSKKYLCLLNQTTRQFAGVFMGIVFSLATFTQLSAQLSVSVVKTDPTCADFTNGTATATATGGVAPYTYRWSNGSTGNTLTSIGAGTFSVTVTGANNATVSSSITLLSSTPINVTFSFASICTGGAVTAIATGGTAPYTYNWGGGRVGATQSGLTAAGYNVIVTDSKGCSAYKFVNVPAPFTAGLRIGELVCFGDCDAAIDALPQGGTGPFTFRWNTGATTGAIIGIPSGTYSVTITDANGCTSNATGTVANPPVVTLTTTSVAPNCGSSSNNGSATVSATGGRPPFSYRWSNGQTGVTATGLGVGTYYVTATDAKGCNKTGSVILTSNAGFTLNATSTNASCGSSNGSATATITGGTAPFTYKWSTNATTQTINNLPAGSYMVTVGDASGCSVVATATVDAVGSLAILLTSTNAACGIANGTATATPTSGTAPFRYLWSNGATTQTIGLLSAGTYNVTVTDANGCTASGQKSITQSSSFDVNLDTRNITCNGGSDGQISAMIMGGSAPYRYSWSNGGTVAVIANLSAILYTVTVTDASGCTAIKSVTITQPTAVSASITTTAATCGSANGSATVTATGGKPGYTYAWTSGATTAVASNLSAGSYTVTVTDANGCRTTAIATVTAGSALNLTLASTAARCNGSASGSATSTVTGGTLPYTYLWSNAATTASITGVAAGNYLLTVNDAAGCSVSQVATIAQPSAIATSFKVEDATCANIGSVTLTNVSGGTAPYTYLWSTNATTASITNLAGGNYTVTITDANGCTKSVTSTVNGFTAPTVTLTPTQVLCNGGNTGAITAAATGGTAPLSFAWSNSATNATITGLSAGLYTVTVTDAKGCTTIRPITLTQPAAIVITPTATSATCLPNGSATATVAGGVAPYTYLWSNGATTASTANLVGGNYTVTATDANGCKNSATINVPAVTSPNLSVTATVTSTITFQGGSGEATAVGANGRAPYTYRWSNNSTLAVASGLAAGTYTVTVTDANGCTKTATVTLSEPVCVALTSAGTITGDQNYCNASELTGVFEATPAVGGTGALEYLWMYSDFTADFSAGGWNTIAGATGKDLPANLLPNIIRKTNFIRCVRRAGCGDYKEGNVVSKTPTVAMSWLAERAPCLGRANVFSATDNGASATYQWIIQGANVTSSSSRVINNLIFNSLGDRTTTLTISKNGCTQTRSFTTTVVNCLADYGSIFAFSASSTSNNDVRLNWATTDEKKTSKYMIEKSADNVNFTLIGTVASQNLPNNLYAFVDTKPKTGRAFYRIHQMTPQEQEVAMSKTEKVIVAQLGQSLVTYPNPVGATLFVEVVDADNTEGSIEIYNEMGSLVKVQQFTAKQIRYEVNTDGLGKGNYILKIRRTDGTISATKISKF